MAFTNNFSTSFRWWDRIFGTDDKYRQYRERMAALNKSTKSLSKEEQLKREQQLVDEVEAEGFAEEAKVVAAASKVKVN